MAEQVAEYREKFLETLAEADDAIMEKYLDEGETFTVEEREAAIRRATLADKLNPVLCGTAFKNKGVQPLLDAVVRYLPFAARGEGRRRSTATRRTTRRPRSSRKPSTTTSPSPGWPDKIASDPHLGKLIYVRVYYGKLEAGARRVLNSGARCKQGADRQGPPDARQQA